MQIHKLSPEITNITMPPHRTPFTPCRFMLVAIATGALHGTGLATPVSEPWPVTLTSTSAGFTITNTSKSYVLVTQVLSGSNFRAAVPCEGTVFLRPGSVSSIVTVEAKDTGKPLDYRVMFTRLETKTLGELRREAAEGKDVPVAKPLSAASARAIEALRCHSQ